MDIRGTIINIINELADKTNEDTIIDDNTNLIHDYQFDSIKLIELIVMIEDEFKLEIEDDDLELSNISIVGNLINIVEKKQR